MPLPWKRPLALVAVLGAVATTGGCVESGRTVHPDAVQAAAECPVEPDPSITTTARIAWQAIPNGDLAVKDLRMLETCMPNAEITWSKFDSGGDVVQAFGAGSVDLGLVGSSPAVRAVSPPLDIDLRVVWLQDVIGAAESLVVRDESITSIQGLDGKKVAVPFGSTAHYSLLSALREAGIDGTVQLINLSPDKMLPAWQRGEVDAAWVWDPTLSQLQSSGSVILTSADTAKAGYPTFDMSAATAEFLEQNPGFMLMWTTAQDAAARRLADGEATAIESLAVQLGLPPDVVRKQTQGLEYLDARQQAGPDYFGGALGGVLEDTAGFLVDARETEGTAPPETYQRMPYPYAIEEVAAR
ncbi:taurine ABC transporter substrate-binding protein [Kocuria arenosa]|uniref:taurine ABC transporter substrate-binding protein n=1 Tax=Kocuria arenosa TaxID=3071446 RepID=UPI0034D48375